MEAINRKRLYHMLGFKWDKLPSNFQHMYMDVELQDWHGNTIAYADVFVHPTRRTARRVFKHRIYVKCSNCWEWIPFGRLHQHIHTKRCDHTRDRKIIPLSSLNVDTSKNERLQMPEYVDAVKEMFK